MIRRTLIASVLLTLMFAHSGVAQPSLPSTFKARTVDSPEGANIFVRSGGAGPVVVLLHGYAETSDSWAPLAAELVNNYTIVVPDLRGIVAFQRSRAGQAYRGAIPAVIAATVESVGDMDFKGDVLAAYCKQTGKLCASK